MSLGLAGRVCVVSGGSRGIGRAVSEALAHRGCGVAILGRDDARAASVAGEVCPGQRHWGLRCDVTSRAEIRAAVARLTAECPSGVRHLVNCAGVTRDRLLAQVTDADLELVLGTNLRGPLVLTQELLPLLRLGAEGGGGAGSVVNVGSIVGERGNYGQSVYASSKAGLIGLTRTLSRELGRHGIRVNLVQPGFTKTEMTEGLPEKLRRSVIDRTVLRRFAEPSEVAEAVVFLLSDASSFVTGQTLSVDGGLAL